MPTKGEPSKLTEGEKENVYQAYLLAEQIQDASNLCGVARSFGDAVAWIRREAVAFNEGSDYIHAHPVVTLFLAKMMALNGQVMEVDRYGIAARQVGTVRCLGPRHMGAWEHEDALASVLDGRLGG